MKKLLNLSLILALVPFLFFASCKKDNNDTPEVNKFEVLKDYLVQNNMDINTVASGFTISADAINAKAAGDYYVIDIRSASDFAAGHINGAVNSTLAGVLDAAKNADSKPIVVVCYTGQTAAHALVALRLSGYADAKLLLWGMSGWTSTLSSPWAGNIGDVAAGNANWVAAPGQIEDNINYNKYPTIVSQYDDGVNILKERITEMLNGGFKGIASSAVLENPSDYFINNYWAATDVETYGNIATAHRINPLTLANDEIAYLNPDKTIVTYCWTGQTSSMVTAYLNILGYNAISLKFGANSMIYNTLTAHKYSVPTTDYNLVSK